MIGKMLGNRYEIVKKIGGGGMALVYKAKCHLLNRYVAVKILRTEFINDDEFIEKFQRESRAAASLSHPNIVNIYDTGIEGDIYYIVMELVEGKTLKELIVEKGKLGANETINIAIQIADALNHAHRNHIIHRDIKPHNILMTDDNRIKVADFGIARAATSSTVISTSNVIGSVHYFSPEQARGGYTDEKSDIYSLGIVMYEMITGRLPFQGDSPITVALKHVQEEIVPPSMINSSIPKNVEKIIMKAVEKNQSLRYNNMLELLSDLRKAQENIDGDCIEYKSFKDSPTIAIPAVKSDKIIKDDKIKEKRNNRKSGKYKRISTILAILLALVIASGLAYGIFYVVRDYLTVEEVKVPDLIGLREEEAKMTIESLGLKFKVKSREYSEDFLEGYVIEQTTKANELRKIEYPIEVIISKGKKLVDVPELVGKHSNEIDILLDRAGLEEGKVIYEYDDVIPYGIVTEQSVEAFTKIAIRTKIDVVISKGPEVIYLLMSDFVGKNVEEVKRDIISNGFVIGNITYKSHGEYERDIVIQQNFPAGTEVEENTAINLIVSSGLEKIPVDDEEQVDDEETSETQENPAGEEQQRSVQVLIKLPQDKDEVEVRIEKIHGDVKELVYNKKHKTSENEIKVNLTGSGKEKIEIYIDGTFRGQKEIEF